MSGTTNLFYPEAKVYLGQYEFTQGVNLEVHSASESYYDWAKVTINKAFYDKVTITKLDNAEIYLGYDGDISNVFKGYITRNDLNEVLIKDDMLKLESLKLTHTFMDAEPSEIVEYCLSQAGITTYKLFQHRYPKRKVVPIKAKTIIQILEEVKRLWKIEDLFYFSRGTFYFGQKPVQAKIYRFEYANNIISLLREADMWVLETASVPFIHHSDIIEILHPKVSGEKEVSKVVFKSNDAGFLRTKIYFK